MKVVFLLENLAGGGVERNTLVLTSLLAKKGHDIKLVVCQNKGPLIDRVDTENVGLHVLEPSSPWKERLVALKADPGSFWQMLLPVLMASQPPKPIKYLSSLVEFLRAESPGTMVAATPHVNIVAVWARRLAGVSSRLILGERIQIAHYLRERAGWQHRFLLPLISKTYAQADAILAVSDGVAEELAASTSLQRNSIQTVYNPVVVNTLLNKAGQPLVHPWFGPKEPPVIISVGRLSDQKDYPTLLKAFAEVRKHRRSRLMIIGEAGNPEKTDKRRSQLRELATQLGVADDLDLPGFLRNPYPYMSAAAMFVLSSTYEGLPTVLIEAMACGCPVVSTANPGAVEILENGKWGHLAPIGDAEALSQSMLATLSRPIDREDLFRRATDFSSERAVEEYERVILGND